MKRYVWIILLVFLAACRPTEQPPIDPPECGEGFHLEGTICVEDEEDPIIDPIDEECTATQIEVNDECITLTGPQMALYNVLLSMEDKDNYQIDVTIASTEGDPIEVELLFDASTSRYQDQMDTIYYYMSDQTCMVTTVRWEQAVTEETTCSDSSYRFYDTFTYDMFTLTGGVFVLNDDELPAIQTLVEGMIEDADVTSLSMQIATDTIASITMELLLSSETYTVTYQFNQYGDVVITVPGE